MSILAWIEEQRQLKLKQSITPPSLSDGGRGLWTRCDCCGVILYIKLLKQDLYVCSGCGHHILMSCTERIHSLIDPGTWNPTQEFISPCDPLVFEDERFYQERLEDTQEKMDLQDAVLTGTGMLDGIPIALGVMEFQFMGGSMGSVVGEKLTRLIESATTSGIAIVIVCASGGARMQEGIFSLMQMAKISAALYVHQVYAKLFYIALLTAPTTGGVTASFAMLGDVVMAEPDALIGFAGRRVIQETLMEELPEEFQTSEYLLYHGMLDLVVPRYWIRQALYELLLLHKHGPLRERGYIPYGVQAGLSPMEEDELREELKSKPWNQIAEEVLSDLNEEVRTNLMKQAESTMYSTYTDADGFELALEAAKEVESFWMEDHIDYHLCGWLGYRPPITPTPQEAPDDLAEEEQILEEQFRAIEQTMKDVLNQLEVPEGEEEAIEDAQKETISREIVEDEQVRVSAEYAHHMEDYLARRERDMLFNDLERFKYQIGERGGDYMYTYRTGEEDTQEAYHVIEQMAKLLESSPEEKEKLFETWRLEAKKRQEEEAAKAEEERRAKGEPEGSKVGLPLSPMAKLMSERIAKLVSDPLSSQIKASQDPSESRKDPSELTKDSFEDREDI
jgi:acetyl-CoA carboxylase carboxyl transferase subunit beta